MAFPVFIHSFRFNLKNKADALHHDSYFISEDLNGRAAITATTLRPTRRRQESHGLSCEHFALQPARQSPKRTFAALQTFWLEFSARKNSPTFRATPLWV